MMVENIFHAEDAEGKGYEEDIVRWVATLNYLKPPSKEDPPTKENLPKQRGRILHHVAQWGISLGGHWMPVNMDALKNFVCLLESFTAWAQYGDIISMLMQGARLFPDTAVERHRKILDNNQDLSFCHCDVRFHIKEIGKL